MNKFTKIAGGIFVGFVAIIVLALVVGGKKDIKETTFADRKDLELTPYCLKGLTILEINPPKIGGNKGGFVYELNAAGQPVACK